MEKKKPFISIITVCYNVENGIEDTILNVASQTYPNYEHIIIDGGSKDDTLAVIKKHQDKFSYWISEPDRGIYDAMNKGVLKAKGDYIYFLNVGDLFYQNTTLEDLILLMEKGDDVVYGNTCLLQLESEVIEYPTPIDIDWKKMPYCHQSVLFKRELLHDCLFDLRYKIAADYNQYFELKRNGANFKYINQIISRYDTNGISAHQHRNLLKEGLKISTLNADSFIKKLKIFYFYQKCKLKQRIKNLNSY